MLESHECSSWESASGKKTGGSEVRVIRNSLYLGSASHVTRPGKRFSPNTLRGDLGSGQEGWGGAARGLGTDKCSKWQRQKQNISLTYPGRLGQPGAGDRALGRHKGTMEKLFQPEPAAERRHGASGPCIRERLSIPAGASAHPGLAAPSGAVAGAISKSFQEVSGPPHPAFCRGAAVPAAAPPPSARPPAALPAARSPFRAAAARRAPPGGVEPAAARAARGGRTGGRC